MQWTPGESSGDIDDRRGESGGGGGFGGGGFGGIHLGIGGTIVVGLLSLLFHNNLFSVFSGSATPVNGPTAAPSVKGATADSEKDFMEYVVKDVQTMWDRVLPQQENISYHHARIELYRDTYPSGCGLAQTATGPFYCPEDERVYLDLGFFNELKTRFGSPGEFAQAYVVAHEIGHHVQKLLGIEPRVRRLQQQSPGQVNPLSVRLELQADCFAGIWAHSSEERKVSNEQDITAGIRAAAAVGDDRLQRAGQGYANPETFTHGSSAQRTQWFQRGLQSGRISDCDTFQQSR